ncbi:MAG: NAD(+) synthase, partial [Bacteroidetes bacterium RIFCSPHIGHO2_02_FULL_44_7]
YCTFYGDMAGAITPLADVYKTEVYNLAEYVNRKKELIPKRMLEKAPSAELRQNQRDRDTLPEYEYLDRVLKAYIEDDIINENEQSILACIKRNEFKRFQMPLGFKISKKAFGSGRDIPIVKQ